MSEPNQFRQIPAVHRLLEQLPARFDVIPRPVAVAEIRRILDEVREAIQDGQSAPASIPSRIEAALDRLLEPSLRPVINATGVVLHTNLGRAPLAPFAPLSGYSNLEYDLDQGRRGRRDSHLTPLLTALTGTAAIAVNNNAAALYLALHTLACGHEVIVSRGELIEIGDGFRIPDIMRASGAIMREVGTTNRTHLDDFREAITPQTRLLLRVHPSNFHIQGFTGRPSLTELVGLGRQHAIPVVEDLGSGCLTDLRPFGITEPLVAGSLAAGVNLVCFSGDKLLGGPQAGILAGDARLVELLRRDPMFRALRLDKLITQVLETTLRNLLLERFDLIPALAMIRQTEQEIRQRAEALAARVPHLSPRLETGRSLAGGGATPGQSIPTCLLLLAPTDLVAAEARLRHHGPPVIARIENDRIVIDLRTVRPEEEADLGDALASL